MSDQASQLPKRGYFAVQDVLDAARGRWPALLAELGVRSECLVPRHGPCPGCGGRDRFRFDDKDGDGTFICSQGGGGLLAGNGMKLLEHALGWDFKRCCEEVGSRLLSDAKRHGLSAHGQSATSGPRMDEGVKPEPKVALTKAVFDYETLRSVERKDWKVNDAWLKQKSPIDVSKVDAVKFVEALYCAGEKVLVFTKFRSQGQFGICPGLKHKVWRLAETEGVKPVPSNLPKGGPDGVWFLSNPVDGKWHVKTSGYLVNGRPEKSRRSAASVTAWRYLVLECDHKEKACPCKHCNGRDNPRIGELWLNFLAQLDMPISAIYTSGGKSVHALVRIEAESKDHWDRIRDDMVEAMVVYGADPAAMTAVRLTRLPGTMRGARPQELLYLNPSPDLRKWTAIGKGGNVCA